MSRIFKGNIDNDDVILPEQYNKVIVIINRGLTEIYRKLNIKTSIVKVQTVKDKGLYNLVVNEALSNNSNGYIVDSIDAPFMGDISQLISLYVDDKVYPLGTTGVTSECSVRVMKNDQILVPKDLQGKLLTFFYQAKHPTIPVFINPEEGILSSINIELDSNYLELLLLYIGSKLYTPVQNTSALSQGDNYTLKYNNALNQILVDGTVPSHQERIDFFLANGFV